MIYLSYFNRVKYLYSKFGIDVKIYSIAVNQWTSYPVCAELRMKEDILYRYKNKKISLEQLKELYKKEVLESLSIEEVHNIAKKYNNCILCCHEKEGCHREVLPEFFAEYGVKCKELTTDDYGNLKNLRGENNEV